MRRPSSLAALTALTLAAGGAGVTTGVAAAAPSAPGEPRATYVVTVAPGAVPAAVANRAKGLGGQVHHIYTAALEGFAVTLPAAAASRLAELSDVVAVERDQAMRATGLQEGATWGLDRIDQVSGLSGTYTSTATGSGVTAYVIDTGIKFGHDDFSGQAVKGFDAFGGTAEDCNGHGTHVAGTVGGNLHGVAKDVSLVAVRVLDCAGSGSTSGVIAGVDWVTRHHLSGAPAVANMSLGGGVSTALDKAVSRSITDGVTYAVAAGNGNSVGTPLDACTTSPARVTAALTVGATDDTDAPASFSNYGKCLDLFAPGVDITSTWHTGTTATNTISGTSMATPHVAGVAALYLQLNPGASPSTVTSAVKALADKDQVPTTRTANNDLLFTNY